MHLDFPPESCSCSLRIKRVTISKQYCSTRRNLPYYHQLMPSERELTVSALITIVTEIAVTVLTQTFGHIFREELGNFPRLCLR